MPVWYISGKHKCMHKLSETRFNCQLCLQAAVAGSAPVQCCTNGCLHNWLSAITCSLHTEAVLPERGGFDGSVCWWWGQEGGECWLSIVIKPPSLYSHPPATTLLAPSFLPPAMAWNRLAPCQGELGLLWLCRKSARKNTNHLFRVRSEQGWGCKYRSLAPSRHPSWPHTQDHRVQSSSSCSASYRRAAVQTAKLALHKNTAEPGFKLG